MMDGPDIIGEREKRVAVTEIQCAPAEMRKGILRGDVGLHNGGCDLGYKNAPLP